ncbi:hypothetical protein [Alicyclobacillus tolerans]|uniref:Uncharacterized protein n=1 Tax=Alicyclobacillus tolerans TaxID=90970 RepID=A0ABT9LZR2_9BACL|nr:hypothetical protein [Alicyclobacillus tengchongensis]MDP9729737.1 hypothetical protein [Alicyclobacillus tengchongensis]
MASTTSPWVQTTTSAVMWRGSLTALDGVTKRSTPWRRKENLVSELENHEITKNSLVRIRELAT